MSPDAAVLPQQVATDYPHSYAVVDVETTGLNCDQDRVVQIAITQMCADGTVESSWTSLVDPGCDPGPSHVHGITADRLRGAPRYSDIAARVRGLLDGRILVAHNARFDHGFLAAEQDRAALPLPVLRRLCTWKLSGMFDLPVPDLKLGTICAYWGVRRHRAHDAEDDVRVLVEVTRHSLAYASYLQLRLPLATPRPVGGYPPRAPRAACLWAYPGRHSRGNPLQQGMTVVFTGPTAVDRADLIREATDAGLDVMNNVSSRTSLLVTNLPSDTEKARRARHHGTSTLTEPDYRYLLPSITAGVPIPAAVPPATTRRDTTPPATAALTAPKTGPLSGHRVIVLGDDHAMSVQVRARVVEGGGSCAVNLTASVTDAVALPGHDRDSRWRRIRNSGLPMLDPETLMPTGPAGDATEVARPLTAKRPASAQVPEPATLPRGGVVDLPVAPFLVTARWTPTDHTGDVDIVAFVTTTAGLVSTDADFCFYNQPVHPTGVVVLDVESTGEATATIDPALLGVDSRIILAAAIDGHGSFGDLGAVELEVRTPEGRSVARATLDAADQETALLLAGIYYRHNQVRVRAIGQGNQVNLATLAVGYGVDIEE